VRAAAAFPFSSYPDPLDRGVNPRWLALLVTAVPVVLALALGCYLRPPLTPGAAGAPAAAESRSTP
jgi:hypothetical protein